MGVYTWRMNIKLQQLRQTSDEIIYLEFICWQRRELARKLFSYKRCLSKFRIAVLCVCFFFNLTKIEITQVNITLKYRLHQFVQSCLLYQG